MKVNQKQRIATRKKIVDAGVNVIIEKSFKNATMREIAKQAGIGDATIYNYFPTKEAILYGYYEDRLETGIENLKKIEGFDSFTLQEQLQSLLEAVLTAFLADREFVQATFTHVFFSVGQDVSRLKPIRKEFLDTVKAMFETAEKSGEIPDMVFGDIPSHLFYDYFLAVIAYWNKDRSDQFVNTTLMIDLSLDMICAVLKTGVLNKAFNVASFLFKNHILSRMDGFSEQMATISRVKNQWMRNTEERDG